MNKTDKRYGQYTNILRSELLPAGGCTEPIAIAYAAAVARKELGRAPERIEVYASGNLIKNAKSVYIPGGGDLRGVDAAAALGALAGNANRVLEVLLDVSDEAVKSAREMIGEGRCAVRVLDSDEPLHLTVDLFAGQDDVKVELRHTHTNITRVEKNGEVLFDAASPKPGEAEAELDYGCLDIDGIVDYANSLDLSDPIADTLKTQVKYNFQVAQEGLANRWGANVGKLYYDSGRTLQAYPAAASDARMSGCNLPVVIVSGSGNQGITASLPVAVYAREHGIAEDKMLRALALSDLVAIHLKSGMGRLSAYCGAVCAATGSGCAMTYLAGGTIRQIKETITNSVAVTSGIVCDGAKPSCAGKIAAGLEGAIMAHELAMDGRAFQAGEGIVMDNVEKTIDAVSCVASQGMRETDQVILKLMTEDM